MTTEFQKLLDEKAKEYHYEDFEDALWDVSNIGIDAIGFIITAAAEEYKEQGAILFAEFTQKNAYKRIGHTDDESKMGKWYWSHHSLLGKAKFYTTSQLFHSEEYKKFKENK